MIKFAFAIAASKLCGKFSDTYVNFCGKERSLDFCDSEAEKRAYLGGQITKASLHSSLFE